MRGGRGVVGQGPVEVEGAGARDPVGRGAVGADGGVEEDQAGRTQPPGEPVDPDERSGQGPGKRSGQCFGLRSGLYFGLGSGQCFGLYFGLRSGQCFGLCFGRGDLGLGHAAPPAVRHGPPSSDAARTGSPCGGQPQPPGRA